MKHNFINDAHRYLTGESIEDIALSEGVVKETIRDRIKKACYYLTKFNKLEKYIYISFDRKSKTQKYYLDLIIEYNKISKITHIKDRNSDDRLVSNITVGELKSIIKDILNS